MKALDKVFDTQVITGIIGDKFYFIEAKENFLYEEGKQNRQEDGIKVTIRYRRKSNESGARKTKLKTLLCLVVTAMHWSKHPSN